MCEKLQNTYNKHCLQNLSKIFRIIKHPQWHYNNDISVYMKPPSNKYVWHDYEQGGSNV